MKIKSSNYQIIIPLLNLFLLALIIMDTFSFRPSTSRSILKDMDLKIGYSRSGSILHYKLIDTKDKKYEVSYDVLSELNIGDSLYITRSGLFNKALTLSYRIGQVKRSHDIGLFNNSGFGILILTLIGSVSILALLLPFISGNRRINMQVLLMATFLTIAVLSFYFLKQS